MDFQVHLERDEIGEPDDQLLGDEQLQGAVNFKTLNLGTQVCLEGHKVVVPNDQILLQAQLESGINGKDGITTGRRGAKSKGHLELDEVFNLDDSTRVEENLEDMVAIEDLDDSENVGLDGNDIKRVIQKIVADDESHEFIDDIFVGGLIDAVGTNFLTAIVGFGYGVTGLAGNNLA